MQEVLIVGIIFFSVVALVKIIADSKNRRHLIEKGAVSEQFQPLTGSTELSILSNLKWGMILVAIGLALFISRFLPYRFEDEGVFGLALVFGGIAFLIYYAIASNQLKEIRRNQSKQGQP